MKLRYVSAAALAALLIGTGAAWAEDDALKTLEGMHMTAPVDWPTVPQTGPKADAVKEILKKIKMPPGFHIDLYALVPDARHMAVGPQGIVTFVGTRKNKIWAMTDRSRSGVARKSRNSLLPWRRSCRTARASRRTASSMSSNRTASCNIRRPNSSTRVPDVAVGVVVPEGDLIPKSRGELQSHCARMPRRTGQKLYIQLGQPYNVPPKEKLATLSEDRHGRHHPHGPGRQEPRNLRDRPAQPGRHGFQSEGQDALVATTIRSTAWATTSRRAK